MLIYCNMQLSNFNLRILLCIKILNTFRQNLGNSVNLLTLMYLGKNKQVNILIVFLILFTICFGQAGKSFKYRFNGDLQETISGTGNRSIIINYSLSELNIENLSMNNGTFYRITFRVIPFRPNPENRNFLF